MSSLFSFSKTKILTDINRYNQDINTNNFKAFANKEIFSEVRFTVTVETVK